MARLGLPFFPTQLYSIFQADNTVEVNINDSENDVRIH
jgi:hypothetical protein